MKIIKIIYTFLTVLIAASTSLIAQIDHVEPPFWWAGMKNPALQILVHDENISENKVELSYEGVMLKSVSSVENPNYLFIDLELAQNVLPGKFDVKFMNDGKVVHSITYELKEREPGSVGRKGFNNSDVMYLIMPDRFANGDPSNDEVTGMREGFNRKKPFGRHGGDIKGIINSLDYLNSTGFTSIWLNPVLENDQPEWSYHGYAATDFYKVDRRFGSNKDYRELGRIAKEKGIKLVMDMIFNHCGSEHWWMKDMPTSDWINYYPEYVNTNHRRTVNQDPHASDIDSRIMTNGWFVPAMPDLNQRNPFLTTYLIQNSIWWIEYVGLAGIRMDTYPYPDKYMMAEWNRRVLEEYPHFNIVGEEWSLNPAIVSYWQKGQINRDGYEPNLPSLMDFPLQSALQKGLTEKETWDNGLIRLYEVLVNDFLYPDPDNLVVFPDNHDMSRFYMQVGMDVDLFKTGIVYILTTRGIPQIFYGTEILMSHTESNSHGDIRKDFPGGWEGDEKNAFTGKGLSKKEIRIQSFFRKLLNWRKENPVIHTGKLTHFVPENGVYVYFRYNDKKKVMIILNKNDKNHHLKLERFSEILGDCTKGKDILSEKVYNLSNEIVLPASTPLILELQ
jgi:glycosidase